MSTLDIICWSAMLTISLWNLWHAYKQAQIIKNQMPMVGINYIADYIIMNIPIEYKDYYFVTKDGQSIHSVVRLWIQVISPALQKEFKNTNNLPIEIEVASTADLANMRMTLSLSPQIIAHNKSLAEFASLPLFFQKEPYIPQETVH